MYTISILLLTLRGILFIATGVIVVGALLFLWLKGIGSAITIPDIEPLLIKIRDNLGNVPKDDLWYKVNDGEETPIQSGNIDAIRQNGFSIVIGIGTDEEISFYSTPNNCWHRNLEIIFNSNYTNDYSNPNDIYLVGDAMTSPVGIQLQVKDDNNAQGTSRNIQNFSYLGCHKSDSTDFAKLQFAFGSIGGLQLKAKKKRKNSDTQINVMLSDHDHPLVSSTNGGCEVAAPLGRRNP